MLVHDDVGNSFQIIEALKARNDQLKDFFNEWNIVITYSLYNEDNNFGIDVHIRMGDAQGTTLRYTPAEFNFIEDSPEYLLEDISNHVFTLFLQKRIHDIACEDQNLLNIITSCANLQRRAANQ